MDVQVLSRGIVGEALKKEKKEGGGKSIIRLKIRSNKGERRVRETQEKT